MLSDQAKKYIEENKELLKEDNFQRFFDMCDNILRCELAEFLLLDCKINFLEYMTAIQPNLFFYSDRLEFIEIPNNITIIGGCAFENCKSLKNVYLSDSIDVIGKEAFLNCESLSSVDLKNTAIIFDHAFKNCKSITSITIPESIGLNGLGEKVFTGCTHLKNIKLPNKLKDYELSYFGISEKRTSVTYY